MSKGADGFSPVLVFKGRHAAASYLEQAIPAYRGNPYIEALPPILTEDEAIEVLARLRTEAKAKVGDESPTAVGDNTLRKEQAVDLSLVRLLLRVQQLVVEPLEDV